MAEPQINTGTSLDSVVGSLGSGKSMDTATYQKGEISLLKETEKSRKDESNISLAKPPELTKAPDQKDYTTNPMQTFGSFGMVIASLGSLMTRHPMISALNAGAEVFKTKAAGDAAGYKNAMDKWKVDSENAWKMADWEQKNFEDMRNKYKDDLDGLNREAEIWANMTKNPALDAAVKAGQVQQYMDSHKKAVEEMNDARENKGKKNDLYEGKLEDWLSNNKNPDGTMKDLKQIPKSVSSKIFEETENEWKKAKEGKLDEGGTLTDDQYEKLRNDPAMQTALKTYKVTGDARFSVGGGTMGGKSLQPKIEALQRMAHEENPDFNPGIVKMMAQGYQKELNGVQLQNGKISLASNILDTSIPSLIDSAKKLGLSESTNINDLYNAARARLNSSDFKNFQTQLRAATTDYAQFLGRGRQTVHSDEEALKILHESMNVNSLGGFKDAVTTERGNVQKGIDTTLQNIEDRMSGKTPTASISNDGSSAESPLPAPEDNKYEADKYYDLGDKGHGIHKYIGKGQFE